MVQCEGIVSLAMPCFILFYLFIYFLLYFTLFIYLFIYILLYLFIYLFLRNALARSNAFFGPGSGTIWLDDVKCTGTETSLDDCSHRPWNHTNCAHDEDVGVDCEPRE